MRPRILVVAVAATAMLVSCVDGPEPIAPTTDEPTPANLARALAPIAANGDQVVFEDNFDRYTYAYDLRGTYARAGAISLTSGRSGKAVRFSYSSSSTYNLLEKVIPATGDLYVSYWYRTSPGADPSNRGANRWGMGMLRAHRLSGQRYQLSVTGSSLLFGIDDSAVPVVGQNVTTTPRFGTTNDGTWHQLTARLVSGAKGYAMIWIDGILVTDTRSQGYTHPATGITMLRFPGELAASPLVPFTVDVDDVVAWRPGTITPPPTDTVTPPDTTPPPAPAPVARMTVSPASVALTPSQTSQLTAAAFDSAGNSLANRVVTWSSSNPAVATVSAAGLVQAVAEGTAAVTATSEGRSASATVTVAPVPVASVGVVLNAPSLYVGNSTQAAATPRDANGNALSGRTITWQSSNASVATVSETGLVSAVGVGSATITATSEGQSGSATVTVAQVPVATVAVSLAASSRLVGETTQATATLRDASNNALTGRAIAWSSSNAAVATVDGSGLVTAVGAGTASIVATSEGRSGQASISVTAPPAPVASVTVSPGSATLGVGATVQLSATTRDASGATLSGRAVAWTTNNASVATVSATGLVRAVAAGSATITATSEGRSGASSITVNAPPPPPPTGAGEPGYDATRHALVVRDDFEYASRSAMMNAYPVGRFTEHVSLVPGRNGSGGAARLTYGQGGAYDIIFGPEGRLGSVGAWNGTLPQKAGPYTHFFFTTWFRFSAGADPAAYNGSGIKGFMFWHQGPESGGRYQNAVNRINQDGRTRGFRGANPDNAQSGLNLYKTPDGRAPLFSTLADGQWHRFTIEIYAGNDPSGHKGERFWVDGQLIYDDVDQPVGPGTAAGHYGYNYPIRHWMVFGNYITEAVGAASPRFTLDVDDWSAWTTR